MHTPVSRSFRQFALNKYPAIENKESFLRFFHYLCFGRFFDRDSHQLVIPTRRIAEDFFRQPYEHHFNGKAFLEEFRDAVLPALSWTGHEIDSASSWTGKARQISKLGFDLEMQQALHEECLKPSEDQVDFVSGMPHDRKDRYRETKEETAHYEKELAGFALNPTQKKILDHLRGLSCGHLLLRKLGNNHGAIEAAIRTLDPELQETQYRILAAVHHNPTLYYLPSANEKTCRLSARGDSLLGLKGSVRKVACSGWVECDLRSSQFAILASELNAPISKKFIDSGESLWRSFFNHTHELEADPPKEIKKVFKEAVYSICFGKSVGNLTRMLNQHGLATLLSHPIIQELLTLRTAWFESIREASGALDVWGHWQALDLNKDPITKRSIRWEGAVAASVIQSIEMEIIAPIFDVANEHGRSDQFKICLFQHDGATISFNSTEKKARAQAKMRKAVEERARQLGVTTVLEFTDL